MYIFSRNEQRQRTGIVNDSERSALHIAGRGFLLMAISLILSACTAINMQAFYKLQDSGSLEITDTTFAPKNPTSPAYFIPFSKDHTYRFSYKSMTFDVYSRVMTTNYSTLIGPLIFPIIPVGIINHIFDPHHRPSRSLELEIHASDLEKNEAYRNNMEDLTIFDTDSGKILSHYVHYNASRDTFNSSNATIIVRFNGKPPRCYTLLFGSSIISTGPTATHATFCRVNRPSLSMGVW
jgi:hypothetical protein